MEAERRRYARAWWIADNPVRYIRGRIHFIRASFMPQRNVLHPALAHESGHLKNFLF
jgi:hypothetical protein